MGGLNSRMLIAGFDIFGVRQTLQLLFYYGLLKVPVRRVVKCG